MKTPPLLLLAALSFWGWQSNQLIVGISAGMILEVFRFFPMRWELAEEDFRRVAHLCVLLALAQLVYTFSVGDTTGNLRAAPPWIPPPRCCAGCPSFWRRWSSLKMSVNAG